MKVETSPSDSSVSQAHTEETSLSDTGVHMDNITSQEYWAEVRAIAQSVRAESTENGQDEHDALHEAVDGHQWIIYTFYNMQVLQHTRNENAFFDDFGRIETDDFSSTMAQLAYSALRADVSEALAALLELPESESEVSE